MASSIWNKLHSGDLMGFENNVKDLEDAQRGPIPKAHRVKAWIVVGVMLAACAVSFALHYKDVLWAH